MDWAKARILIMSEEVGMLTGYCSEAIRAAHCTAAIVALDVNS